MHLLWLLTGGLLIITVQANIFPSHRSKADQVAERVEAQIEDVQQMQNKLEMVATQQEKLEQQLSGNKNAQDIFGNDGGWFQSILQQISILEKACQKEKDNHVLKLEQQVANLTQENTILINQAKEIEYNYTILNFVPILTERTQQKNTEQQGFIDYHDDDDTEKLSCPTSVRIVELEQKIVNLEDRGQKQIEEIDKLSEEITNLTKENKELKDMNDYPDQKACQANDRILELEQQVANLTDEKTDLSNDNFEEVAKLNLQLQACQNIEVQKVENGNEKEINQLKQQTELQQQQILNLTNENTKLRRQINTPAPVQQSSIKIMEELKGHWDNETAVALRVIQLKKDKCTRAHSANLTTASNGKKYFFSHPFETNWFDARKICIKMGLHLATLNNTKDLQVVWNMAEGLSAWDYWVSARSYHIDGKLEYHWADSSKLGETSDLWAPKANLKEGGCVHIRIGWRKDLHVDTCNYEGKYFICEMPSECY
ncbi:centromere-associated protein E-like [Neocloeon triangulifer]|uniref:centromere-associated protein E-like n=1 Tax=Neocloeon triangulifer TaxID=2078957 RepID=UPI00286F57AC|nr:centromere-associated protein E-like [Neocloeon triangulifer]